MRKCITKSSYAGYLIMVMTTTLSATHPLVIAHRGASAYATENTITAFKKALDYKVWGIECDVRRCKSGELVVMHDAHLNRVAGIHNTISDMTLEELRSVNLKDNETIPTLTEALDAINAQTNIMLDIKEEGVAEDLATLIHSYVATKGWLYDQFFATGFEHREQHKLHTLIPAVRIVPAIAGTPHKLAQNLHELDAYAFCARDDVFSLALFNDAVERGIKGWIYIGNEDENNIKKFINLNVAALMVNTPDKAYKIFMKETATDKTNIM